jgi:hypothetical protein
VHSVADRTLLLDGRLEAVDSSGRLPDVQVTTAYGVERRQVVIPGHAETLDVVSFSGEERERVADVRLAAGATVQLGDDCDRAAYVTLDGVDRNGAVVGTQGLRALRFTNPDPNLNARVQPVLLVFDVPAEGLPQQTMQVIKLGDDVRVPAHGSVDVLSRPSY